jgi:hypothetical protein
MRAVVVVWMCDRRVVVSRTIGVKDRDGDGGSPMRIQGYFFERRELQGIQYCSSSYISTAEAPGSWNASF